MKKRTVCPGWTKKLTRMSLHATRLFRAGRVEESNILQERISHLHCNRVKMVMVGRKNHA